MKALINDDLNRNVSSLLTRHAVLRDDDAKLIANVWALEIGTAPLESMSARELLDMLAKGKLTPAESITRCRRKLQETTPSLRGRRYSERHGRVKPVQKELGYA